MVLQHKPQQGEVYLFVYGTLKRGLSNHHWLGEAGYIAEARTAADFALYTIEYPFLAKSPALYPVHGELYLISPADLARVDQLEQHPDDYCREPIEVLTRQGERVMAWTYFHPQPRGILLPDGVFSEEGCSSLQPSQPQ